MYRFGACGLTVALSVGAASAADPPVADPPPAQSRSLFDKLFFTPPPKPPVRPTVAAPLTAEAVVAALTAEQKALSRRMEVCLRLREIAVERNDEALGRRADDLERQATAIYNQRVTALGVPKVKVPLPEPSSTIALDRQLGSGVSVNPLSAPTAPMADIRTAEIKPATDPIREVTP